MAKKSIRWGKKAWGDFIKTLEYITEDSPGNAIRVGHRITNIISALPKFPEMYKEDELKINNDGSFRVFVQNRIRVTYRIKKDVIRIERVRHSSQEPFEY